MILTLENDYGKYSVEIKGSDQTLDDLFEQAIEPLLVAIGYSKDSIDKYLSGEPL